VEDFWAIKTALFYTTNETGLLNKRFLICSKNIQISTGGILLNDKKVGIVFSFIFGSLTLLTVLILLIFSFFGEEIIEFLKDGFSEHY